MSSMMTMGALESLFDAEQTAAVLLEAVKDNVDNTVKTVDAAAALENKLSEEAARFNECLTTMSNAIRKCERGEISREEMLAECAPCVSALKEKCTALTLGNVKTTGDDITEPEIAMLREYIVGCKDIVAARKQELQDCACASEGLMASLANFEPATEGSNGKTELVKRIRQSNEKKTADELYKQAKKLYGLGSKEKALEYLKKSQGLYEGCLEKAQDAGKMYETERTIKFSNKNSSTEDKFKKQVTDNRWMANLIAYFEDRIDSCKALEMQWNNKAGKSTYAETKAQLKAERKETRAANRAARKAARKGGSEEEEFEANMESLMNSIELDLAMEAAMEAEGDEGSEGATTASGFGTKLRAAFSKLKRAKETGDEQAAAAADREIAETADELSEAAQDAETPEEKAKLSKAAKIGLAAAATAAAVVGLTALATKAGAKAEEKINNGYEVSKLDNMLKNISSSVRKAKAHAAGHASQLAARRQDAAQRNKDHRRNARIASQFRNKKYKGANDEPAGESFLSGLAFGLEEFIDIDDEEDEKSFNGEGFDLDEVTTEAAIAVMLAEDGIDDSDLF